MRARSRSFRLFLGRSWGAISDRQIEFEDFDRNQTDLLPLYFLRAPMLAYDFDNGQRPFADARISHVITEAPQF
jgi:hypothetical protein